MARHFSRTRVSATRRRFRWRLPVVGDDILGVSSFNDAEGVWSERLENVRNLVRQQVIHQQLMTHTRSAALAYRAGLRRQWQLALATFDATTYVSELCDDAEAHTLA